MKKIIGALVLASILPLSACTVAVRPPRAGLVFVDGVWVARPYATAVWVPGHWARNGWYGRAWVGGHWR